MNQSYWENINPKQLTAHIDALPAKHDLFYFAKLVAEGLRHDMDPVAQFRHARIWEGTMRYLSETQQEGDIARLELLYAPFFFISCKLFPSMKPGTFGHVFQQFVRFASASEQVPNISTGEATTLVQGFWNKIKKGRS